MEEKKEKTVKDVLDTMDEDQMKVLTYLVNKALGTKVKRRNNMAYEPVRILKEEDKDYPEAMKYKLNKEKYSVMQVGDVFVVPLFQVIDEIGRDPVECINWQRDDDGNIRRACRGYW